MLTQHRHGAQGQFDGASKATLDNEFGTHVDDEVIRQILEKGTIQETEVCSPFPTPYHSHTTLMSSCH